MSYYSPPPGELSVTIPPLSVEVPPSDFFQSVAEGQVSGYSHAPVYGHCDDVDTATSPADVWPSNPASKMTYFSSAQLLQLSSTSLNDIAVTGTGARAVQLIGLDDNYDIIFEVVGMNGTLPALTTLAYRRVLYLVVSTLNALGTGPGFGNAGTNVGTITAQLIGGGSPQSIMPAGRGRSLNSHFTIPAGSTGYLQNFYSSAAATNGSTGVKECKVSFFYRTSTGPWIVLHEFAARSDGTSISPDQAFDTPTMLQEKSDIRCEVKVDNNNSAVFTRCGILLKDIA